MFPNEKRDALVAALLFLGALALYWRTLAPSVLGPFDDSLEIQYVIPRLGILHPTGYPLYTLLGKLFTLFVPLNDPAFRLNLFSACCAALTISLVYLVAQKMVASRVAACAAALTFATGETFWAQAVAAEVYALQMLLTALILWLTLRSALPSGTLGADRVSHYRLYAVAFALGLGLTHHRLVILLYPAIALYVILTYRALWRDLGRETLARAALVFLAPLFLYLYLPWRGGVGSADGTYENTLPGFIAWITGAQYTVFLTQDPLQVQHDPAFYQTLFQNQFTWAGLALAAIGVVELLRQPRVWMLLILALVLQAGFAFNYRTADVEVHFLTTFLLIALLFGAGADALLSASAKFRVPNGKFDSLTSMPTAFRLLLSACLFIVPLHLWQSNYAANDLSQKWDVYDYGVDLLTQPFEANATVIGIQGEITLMRYFQTTQGIRPDVETIAADREDARLAALEQALRRNRAAYLTRPLRGAPEKHALSSVGPLIRVQPKPITSAPPLPRPFDADFGAVRLVGYDIKTSFDAIPRSQHAENGKVLRVTLYWQVEETMPNDALVSLKILRADQRILGQTDHRPVLDAYLTNAWRRGEWIVDTYDVPVFFGVTPSDYTVNVTLYDANSGGVIGQADLHKIALGADLTAPRRAVWNIEHTLDADFSALALVGYSLDLAAPVRPGDALPLTLLWRAGWQKPSANLVARISLEDDRGRQIASRDALISLGYPPFQWQPNMFVRDWAAMHVPANIADGKYAVKLAVARGNELLGSTWLPIAPTIVDLGQVVVENRARVMTAPTVARPLDAVFDQKMKLLGYDLRTDAQQKSVHVTLYWRALAQMNTFYTVFVHLLDRESKVVASGDGAPGNGEFPTTGWIEGEYIVDVHTLPLESIPRGTYQIEIGVYDPVTGMRLKGGDGQDRVLLEEITKP